MCNGRLITIGGSKVTKIILHNSFRTFTPATHNSNYCCTTHTGRRNTSDTAGSFVSFTRAWASCQLRKIAVCTCTGNDGNVYFATAGKRIPACITARASHVMHAVIANYGLVLKSVAGKKFRAFLAHAQSAMLIISYEDHAASLYK